MGTNSSPNQTEVARAFSLVVVVVIVPVVLVVPAMLVFVPPLVKFVPAALARFMELLAPTFGVGTLRPIFFNGDVQQLIGTCDALLAVFFALCVRPRHRREKQHPR